MKIGDFNDLKLLRFTSVGAYLADDEDNEVLLPNKYITDEMSIDDMLRLYVYRDSEDRPVATTEVPHIKLNGFAYLKITSVNFYGAFADWGLEKELLIPYKEQQKKLEEGQWCLCVLLHDADTDRLYGSSKIRRHLQPCEEKIDSKQPVEVLICDTTDLGTRVIVSDKYEGIIYSSDMHKNVRRGERVPGFVSKVREDGKLDVRLEKPGYGKIEGSVEILLNILQKDGYLPLTDKSDPELIKATLGMSKKTFKQAVGFLYREKLIKLDNDKIELLRN